MNFYGQRHYQLHEFSGVFDDDYVSIFNDYNLKVIDFFQAQSSWSGFTDQYVSDYVGWLGFGPWSNSMTH